MAAIVAEPNFSPWQHTDQLAAEYAPGLPAVIGAKGFGVGANIGATKTLLNGGKVAQPIQVMGLPSLTISQMGNGGTEIKLVRKSPNAMSMTDADLALMKADGAVVLQNYIAMSTGGVKQAQLTAQGHPYSRRAPGFIGIGRSVKGKQGVVPPLTVINEQTGLLRNSWKFELVRFIDRIEMVWTNDAPESWYVIHGTRTMIAHGPATYALVNELGEINKDWANAARNASIRGEQESDVEASLAI